jgi:RES domain-containing protein
MGLVKSEWMESQERGWDAPDKFVCVECVEDEYLKSVIANEAVEKHCDYCNRKSKQAIAAPVAAIIEPIAYTLFSRFAEPGAAGLPRDSGEWVGEEQITDTYDALLSLPLDCETTLFEEIAESFHNTAWYPCAGGHWMDVHEHDELRYAWSSFEYEIKHRSRYFLFAKKTSTSGAPGELYSPRTLLQRIGKLVQELDLIRSLSMSTRLYRVRRSSKSIIIKIFDDIGPPPDDRVAAGRMNPPGISYFYLAFEQETALAEVINKPPCHAAIGEFETKMDLTYLDLTELPSLPSIFDSDRSEEREGLIFLEHFIDAIAAPVTKDGREHVDYLPSQVVCEFFSQMFHIDGDAQLDGIAYPSAVRPGGKNFVIFPTREYGVKWEDRVQLKNISWLHLRDWVDVKKSI